MNRKLIIAASLAATLGVVGVAKLYAVPPGGGQRGARLVQLRDDLGVSADQKKQLRDLVVAHRADIAAALRPIVEDRRALKDATLSDPIDEAAVRAAADKLGKDIGEAALLAGKLHKDVATILTPEQLKTLGDFGEDVAGKVDSFLDRLETGGKR